MIHLADDIRCLAVGAGQVGLFWLGQAGFVLKTPAGQRIYIDAYLSDSVERKFGPSWKRVMPSLLSPDEVEADWLVSTHEHDDHLDVDALPLLAARLPQARFAGPSACVDFYRSMGLPPERYCALAVGGEYALGDALLRVGYADHGDLAPDAVGLVIEVGGLRIYHSGDTAFRPQQMQAVQALRPQVLLACINGAYGNLNAQDAARLADFCGAQWVAPTHFWTFIEHYGDPAAFLQACRQLAPHARPYLMRQGEGLLLDARDFS